MTLSFAAFLHRHARMRRVTDFIGASLDDSALRLEDVAAVACLSPSQLMRFYWTRTGETPLETVRRMRLQRAFQTLVQHPERSVTEVAFAAGYASNAAFTHAFSRLFRCAPGSLRIVGAARPRAAPELHLTVLPTRAVWQFRYIGRYSENGYYKARLAWLCVSANRQRWRGWRINDCDAPFTERGDARVDLAHFVPVAEQPHPIGEADRVSVPGGLYAVLHINPLERDAHFASLPRRAEEELGCRVIDGRSLERDLHLRHFAPPQERRIALYVPVERR